MFWEVEESTFQISWHRFLDLLGIGEVEVVHELNELILLLGQPGVHLLLLPHSGASLPFVVMGWVHSRVFGKAQDVRPDRLVEGRSTATLEISSSASSDQKCISSVDGIGLIIDITYTAGSMAWSMSNNQLLVPKFYLISMFNQDISFSCAFL